MKFEIDSLIRCDCVHIKETFINIFKNSIEAMKEEGDLFIGIRNCNKWIIVSVKDNEAGISKENLKNIYKEINSRIYQ